MVQETPQVWPHSNVISQIPLYPELAEETKQTNQELYKLYTWTDPYTYIDLFFSFDETTKTWLLEKQYEGHIDQHIVSVVASLSHEEWKEMQFHYARAGYDYQAGKFVLKWPIVPSNEYLEGEEEEREREPETREEIPYDTRFFPSVK